MIKKLFEEISKSKNCSSFFCPQPSVWDVKMDAVSNLVLDNNSLLIFAL